MISRAVYETLQKVEYGAFVVTIMKKVGLLRRDVPEDVADDIASEALLALVKARDSYNKDLGFTFATHEYGNIRWEILEQLRKPTSPYGRVVLQRIQLLSEVEHRLQQALHRPPLSSEIATEMKISVRQLDTVLIARKAIKADTQVPDEYQSGEASLPDYSLYRSKRRRYIRTLVHQLPKYHRTLVTMFFFDGMTVEEIAQKLGLSVAYVRNSKCKAVNNLRAIIIGSSIGSY